MVLVVVEVVLKYSLNLVDDPDCAAVAAALARDLQLLSAVSVDDLWDVEHPDCTAARTLRGFTALGTNCIVIGQPQ